MATYSKAIAEGGTLGLLAVVDRSCETAGESGPASRLHRLDGFLRAQALVQPHSETS